MNSRPIDDAAVLQRKPGSVPGTDDALTNQLAFRKRRAEVRAGPCQGEHLVATADKQDGYAIMLGASGLVIL